MTVRMQPASAADSMHMYICEQAEHIECGFVVCLHGGCYTSGGLRRSWASVIDQLRFGLCLLVGLSSEARNASISSVRSLFQLCCARIVARVKATE